MKRRKYQNIERGPVRETYSGDGGNHYWNFVVDISAFYDCGLYPINITASAKDARRRIIISNDVVQQMRRDQESVLNYQRVLHFLDTYILPHKDGEIELDHTSFKITDDSTMIAATRLLRDPSEYVSLVVSERKVKNFDGLINADVIPVGKGYLPWRGWFEYKKVIGSRYEVRADIRQCYNVIMPRRYVAISDAIIGNKCEVRFYHGQLQYSIEARPDELSDRILLEYLSDPSVRVLFVGTKPDEYSSYGMRVWFRERSNRCHIVDVRPDEVHILARRGLSSPASAGKTCFIIERAQELDYGTIKRLYQSLDRIPYSQQCRIVFLYRNNEPFELPVQEFARDYAMHDRVATIEEYVPKE